MTATSAPTPSTWGRTTIARLAGGLYLAYILANVLASLVGHIGLGDARTLRETIADHEVMFRVGLVAALASGLLFVLTAWALDVLLRPVNEPLALLLLALNAVGVAIQCASYLTLSTVLAQSDGTVGTNELTGPNSTALPCCGSTRTGPGSSPLSCSSPPGCSRSAGWCCVAGSCPGRSDGCSYSTASRF